MKALLMHVAADSSNYFTVGKSGPVFPDGSFEYVPIVECYAYQKAFGHSTEEDRTYECLPTTRRSHGASLADFVPSYHRKSIVHYDPDVVNMTYGEPASGIRGKQLAKLEEGDALLFAASLALICGEGPKSTRIAKYIIAQFSVEHVFHIIKRGEATFVIPVQPNNPFPDGYIEDLDQDLRTRLSANAHLKRNVEDALIVVGKIRHSTLFDQALRITTFGTPFNPNRVGVGLFGRRRFQRGFKWIRNEARLEKARINGEGGIRLSAPDLCTEAMVEVA